MSFRKSSIRQRVIKKTLSQEEESFNRTIEGGMQTFDIALKVTAKAVVERTKLLQDVLALKGKWTAFEGPVDRFRAENLALLTEINTQSRMLGSLEVLRYVGDVAKGLQRQSVGLLSLDPALREVLFPDDREDSRRVRFTEGLDKLEEGLKSSVLDENILPGRAAFVLYDTFGFPLDLTELMARERGLTVEVAEFDRLMEEQKARGKAAQKKEVITVEGGTEDSLKPTFSTATTNFNPPHLSSQTKTVRWL